MRNPLYLLEQGSRLTREGRRLVVTLGDAKLAEVAVIQISQVILFGNVQVTTQALQLLLDEGVEVVLLSTHGRFYGRLVGAPSGHGALRVAQMQRARDPEWALHTAQRCVRGKIQNDKVFLQRYARRAEDPSTLDSAISAIDAMRERVARTTTIPSLMGVEGQASAAYFGVWKALLKPPWRFDKRVRRPPTDPVNILLSFGYTLLVQNVLTAVLTAGLEPYVGFLHQVGYNKPSLALDLAEEFRPMVVDSVVMRCCNNELLDPEHFVPGDEEYPLVLTAEGRKIFIRELETRFTQEFKHLETQETTSYRRLFLLQAYRMAAAIGEVGAEPYRPFLIR